MTDQENASPRHRRGPPRARLQIRLDEREREEIAQAVKAAGCVSPVALLLSLIRQQRREAEQTAAFEKLIQVTVHAAVAAAIGSLADRLAADLAALSAALDERPTKAQMSGFLAHFRTKVTP